MSQDDSSAGSSGARVLAPDLFGFGRSDKPVQDSAYTFQFHREFLLRFVEYAECRNITLVAQDWGAILGLTLPVDAAFRAKLRRLIVMNTVLPVGKALGPHFYQWREMVRKVPDLPIGQMVRKVTPQLTDTETAAYDAPFPDVHYKAGVRTFPELAMVEPEMDGVAVAQAAVRFWTQAWSGSRSWRLAQRRLMAKTCKRFEVRFVGVQNRSCFRRLITSFPSGEVRSLSLHCGFSMILIRTASLHRRVDQKQTWRANLGPTRRVCKLAEDGVIFREG